MTLGSFVHNIDPVIVSIGDVHLWWYGASYTLGFLGAFFWLRRVRRPLGFDMADVHRLVLFLAVGVLAGGRLVEVLFYEWAHYGTHPWRIPAVWLGGMSTHGILLGAVIGVWLFCRSSRRTFLPIADELAIAGAYIMGVGRIGNFIDGQITGSLASVPWAVQFPDADGFRHPVVLYDGLKNLLLVPVLILIRRTRPAPGVVLGHFVLWYGFLRIFVDFFREYRTDLFGLPPGQGFNIVMTLAGVGIILWARKRKVPVESRAASANRPGIVPWIHRLAFAILLAAPLVIPSDWTQDVPGRYSQRHPGMEHSFLYPQINQQEGNAPSLP